LRLWYNNFALPLAVGLGCFRTANLVAQEPTLSSQPLVNLGTSRVPWDSELAPNAMLWNVALVAIMVLSNLTVRQKHYI
ncbi:GGDEF domain-containing protein, partial [Vibrio cholerae]